MQKEDKLVETTKIICPDGGWGWIVVSCSFFCNFVVDGVLFTMGGMLKEISETFQVLETTVGVGVSVMIGFYAILAPITSLIINKWGFRVVAISGGILGGIAFLICTLMTSISGFIFFFGVLGGLGFGMVYLPSIVIVGYYFEKIRSFATSIAVTGSAMGITLLPILFDKAFPKSDWKSKFYFIMGSCLTTSLLAITYIPIKPKRVLMKNDKVVKILEEEPNANDPSASASQAPKTKKAGKATVAHVSSSLMHSDFEHAKKEHVSIFKLLDFSLMTSPAFVVLVISGFITFLGFFIPLTYVTQRANQTNMDENLFPYLYTTYGISNALGRLLSGCCASLPGSNPLLVSWIFILIAGLASIGSYFVTQVYSQFIYIAIYGITSASIAAIRAPIVADMLGLEHLSSGYSIMMVFFGTAGFLWAPMVKPIIDKYSFNEAYLFAGTALAVSALMLIPIYKIKNWETRRKERQQ